MSSGAPGGRAARRGRARGDEQGEPLDDRRLADTRLADEHRIVLLPPREDLHDALDLLGCPIFAITPKVETQRRMALLRNVTSLFLEQSSDRDEVLRAAEDLLLAQSFVQRGDLIVLTIGEPMGKSGGTNTMKIVRVGDHRA